jgi:hypothetical protein
MDLNLARSLLQELWSNVHDDEFSNEANSTL